jgi:predicted ATP-grasp superfamily ATP-dependent carboligase
MMRAQPTLRQAVMRLAAAADHTLVIAPESDGIHEEICQWVVNAGGKLLGPGLEDVRRFSDKMATAELLGLRAIPTTILPKLPATNGPLVVKPRRGAGAEHTALGTRDQVNTMMAAVRCQDYTGELIVQPLWPGQHASVTVVTQPGTLPVILPAVQQLMESRSQPLNDGTVASAVDDVHWYSYKGGQLPLPPCLDDRARDLADYVLQAAPSLHGYFGIDLILSPGSDGRFDRIVEVNPRITSSYTGYSELFGGKFMGHLLLGKMTLSAPESRACVQSHRTRHRQLRFVPDGGVKWESTADEHGEFTSRA